MKRNSIAEKMIYGIIALALMIIISIGALVCYGVVVLSSRHYIEDTLDYATVAAQAIQGDRIPVYSGSGVKDEYYYDTDSFLRSLCKEVDLTEISVVVPYDDEYVYVWDTGYDGEFFDLGETEEYDVLEKELVEKALSGASKGAYARMDMENEGQFLFVFSPVTDSRGMPVAVISVMRPYLDIKTILAQFILGISVSIILVSGLIMLIAYRVLKKSFLEPISILTRSAEKMVDRIERDEVVNVDIHTGDELETLAEAFSKMDVDLRDYIKELSAATAEKERIGTELNVAAQIQTDMLPKMNDDIIGRSEFILAASSTPAKEVGGDFYDFFMVDNDHLALVIADVSGKGVPAALFMVISKVLLKSSMKACMDPEEALADVNQKLLEGNNMGMFVTVWVALIDLKTGEGLASNAGHEHPAIRRGGSNYELEKYKHSPAIATIEGLRFKEHRFKLEPGDSLFVYTDGVTEASDSNKRLFGEERLVAALNKDSGAHPEKLLKSVENAIEEFVGDAQQFDDITMMAFRYNGK